MLASPVISSLDDPPTHRVQQVWRWEDGEVVLADDRVANEIPIALEYNGISQAVMLATPHDLVDLAFGFSLTEGMVNHPSEIYEVTYDTVSLSDHRPAEVSDPFSANSSAPAIPPSSHNGAFDAPAMVLRITIASAALHRLKTERRAMAGRTGCGLCGVDNLGAVCKPLSLSHPPSLGASVFSMGAIAEAMSQLPAQQSLQTLTGATHASAVVETNGEVRWVREDVGRHNALDKTLGAWAQAQRKTGERFPNLIDNVSRALIVTSRASFEMVQKSIRCGFSILSAVSAPTATAIDLAEAYGVCLIGFLRVSSERTRAVIYTHPERVGQG